MSVVYLLVLIAALGCVALLDARYRLFFRRDTRRAALTLGIGVAFFLVWDLAGIGLGIFFRAETEFMTGILLAPELPLEELLFLAFLCYLTMILVLGAQRIVEHRRSTDGRRT